MEEVEFLTAISTLRSEAGFHGMNFFTVWTGYMVAIYLVGDKLSRTFAILISIIYTFYLISPASGLFLAIDTAYLIADSYRQSFPETEMAIVGKSPVLFLSVALFSAWFVSLLFLFQRRKIIIWS